jgi:transcriptional regulator with XRE-family HTH domain
LFVLEESAMDVPKALALVAQEAARSSQSQVAKRIGVPRDAVTRWKSGGTPTGKSREKLLAWAQTVADRPEPPPVPPVVVPSDYWRGVLFAAEVMAQTVADLLKQAREANETERRLVTQFAATLAPTDPTGTESSRRGTSRAAPHTARHRDSEPRE